MIQNWIVDASIFAHHALEFAQNEHIPLRHER